MTTPVSLLLDPRRMMVAGSVIGSPRNTAEIAEHTGLPSKDALIAVGELRSAGLVHADGSGYVLPLDVLARVASAPTSAAHTPPETMDPFIGYGMTDDEQRVLRRFFTGRSLTHIPSGRNSRIVVLERLCLEFDVGRHYSEHEVNEVLQAFHPDTAALRRYLVDEDLLDRAGGEYWRSGGRVTADR